MVDPIRSISDRLNKSVASISGVEKEYATILQVTEKALDKLAEIVRGMDELDMLSQSIHRSREKLTRMAGELRSELGSGVAHMREGKDTLTDAKESLTDDATLLNQKLMILAQSNPALVKDILDNTTDFSLGVAIARLDLEKLTAIGIAVDKALKFKADSDEPNIQSDDGESPTEAV